MRIVIPTWQGRVSPVFDVAGVAVLAEFQAGALASCEEVPMVDLEPTARVRQLEQLGVDRLICGGISAELAGMIRAAGIEVLPNIHGTIDCALRAFSSTSPIAEDQRAILDVHANPTKEV